MVIQKHQTVKVSAWDLPKNSRGHPIFAEQDVRRNEVVLMDAEAIPSGSQWNVPIDMANIERISIYGEVSANHPFYIFTNGVVDEKLYLLKEVSPVNVDGEYHYFVQLENTPRYLWIATGTQGLTFTTKYTQIDN